MTQTSLRTAVRQALFCAAILLESLVAATSLKAQTPGTGTIHGRVSNADTGDYLRNATITISGTEISTTATSGGTYVLNNVPAGEVTLEVAYVGLDTAVETVKVEAGQMVERDFNLTSKDYNEVITLGEFKVQTGREGNAKAIMEQRAAVNFKKVIAADAIGNVSEGNVGEFLKLMPGVAMDYVEADTRAMRVRGLNPKYANVLFDGMQVANAGSSNVATGRSFEFEQLSITSVETVELTKAPTPDQPSTVAGTVNLKSKSAFDRKGRHISFDTALSTNSYYASVKKTEGWDNEKHYKMLPNFNFEYSDVMLDGHLGVIGGFSRSHTIAAQKHVWFFNPAFNNDYADNAYEMPRYTRIWYQDGPKPTQRGNYNLRLDYKVDDSLSFYGRVDYTTYDARFYNRTMNLFPGAPVAGATWTDQTTTGYVQTDSNQFMTKEGNTTMLTGGGVFKTGNFTANLGLHYSRARNWYGNLDHGHFTDFIARSRLMTWRMTRPSADSSELTFTQLSGNDWRNISNYDFVSNSIGWHERRAKDQQWTARLDFVHDFSRWRVSNTLKYGVSTNMKVLDVKRAGLLTVNPTGQDGVMSNPGADGVFGTVDDGLISADDLRPANFIDTEFRSDWDFGGNMNDWPALSPWKLYGSYISNPNQWTTNTASNDLARLRGNWDFKEKIHSAYVSDTFKFGNFEVTPGLRYESTDSEGTGISTTTNGPSTGGTEYNALLKYLHLSYKFTRDIQARASYHEAITRADIGNLVPGITAVDDSARTISGANPDLKPERSKTINIGVEYYLKPMGAVSMSVFRTEVNDRQFANRTIVGSSGYGGSGAYAGYTLFGPVNIAQKTDYTGVEFDYSQQLTFLPGALKGFGVFFNHTRVRFDDWAFNTGSPLWTYNGGLSYNHKRFSARLNLNWVGKLLQNPARAYSAATNTWSNAAPFVQVYQKDRKVTDINFEYKLTGNLTLFVDGRNVLNEPSTYTYFENEDNFERILKTGGIWMFGLKGRF